MARRYPYLTSDAERRTRIVDDRLDGLAAWASDPDGVLDRVLAPSIGERLAELKERSDRGAERIKEVERRLEEGTLDKSKELQALPEQEGSHAPDLETKDSQATKE
jgi:hypothetical protein